MMIKKREEAVFVVRIAVVEDDPVSAELLKAHLQQFFQERAADYTLSCFSDGKDILENYRPVYDLIFLDIEMPGVDGMTAARTIRQTDQQTVIIFVTQMAQYAVKGYEVNALDFILKPVDYFSFAFKMQRVMSTLELRQNVKIMLHNASSWQALYSLDIYYIEVLNHDLIFHTKNGVHRTRGSLNEMEKKLSRVGFRRCSKSFLLNLAHVTAVEGSSISVGGDTIPLSRSMRKELLCALADYYGGKA